MLLSSAAEESCRSRGAVHPPPPTSLQARNGGASDGSADVGDEP